LAIDNHGPFTWRKSPEGCSTDSAGYCLSFNK